MGEKAKLAAIDRLVALSQEFLRLTEARVNEGEAAPLERDLLKVELSREQALRVTARGRVDAALVELGPAAATPIPLLNSLAPLSFPDPPACEPSAASSRESA